MSAAGVAVARARSIVGVGVAQVAAAGVLVALGIVPILHGAQRDLAGTGTGLLAGLGLYYAVAFDPRERRIAAKSAAFVKLAALLAAVAIGEEILWRGWALVSLRQSTGTLAALAATTIGFSAAHASTQGWNGIRTHLVTGLVMGLAFVLTGSLVAAIVTHLSYNLMFLRTIAPQGRLFP